MKVKDLIANLQKENQENEVWVESQDGTNLLDIIEVTDGAGSWETFTVIVLEESAHKEDRLSISIKGSI